MWLPQLQRLALLSSRSTEIIDTTCPLVRRVHEATQTLQSENRLVIVIGRRNHVEVQGIVEDLRQCIVVENVNHPGTTRSVDATMYRAMKQAWLWGIPD